MPVKKAYFWVPSLYFFQSIPFAVVNLISLVLYQQIGLSNTNAILLSTLFMLPWSLKLLIVPFLENKKDKKKLVVVLQGVSSLLLFALALAMNQTYFLPISIVFFSLLALVSAMHDIVSDALYLTELDSKNQKIYVGIRTVFYQIGLLFVKGGLLIILIPLALYYQFNSWTLFFFSLCALVSLLTLYHHYYLPFAEVKIKTSVSIKIVAQNIYDFCKTHSSALLFIFIFNVSTAPMQKILPLFLLDSNALDLNISQVSQIYGLWGTGSFMLGVYFCGYFLSHYSQSLCLKGSAFLMALGQGLFMSVVFFKPSILLVSLVLIINQFITGLANGTYMGYLLTLSHKSDYPMSAYTLCTSLMTLGCMCFGALGGFILPLIDYHWLFIGLFGLSLFLMFLTGFRVNSYE